jgi:phenylalanyl-tRNA synthetase beta chain
MKYLTDVVFHVKLLAILDFCFSGILLMKVLLSWLREYVDIDRSPEQAAEILSNIGFPYEGIEYLGDPATPGGFAGTGDAIVDVEVTSNRGDCLSYIGIARELAAATGKQLKLPAVSLNESSKSVAELAGVEILEPDLCCRYTARVVEGVKVGQSPDWLRNRLEAVGMRSVNNVVDATNYAMLETGQPPHAFDYAKIAQGKIIVRKARQGEQLVSIDGTKCDLKSDMLIIADAKGPVAIAGVMGGLDMEVGDSTTMILLEDAYFDPAAVRSTSRKLALPSEASFRFERIVDIENVDWASKRTCQLIIQVAGGRAAKGVVDVYPKKPKPKQVALRPARLNKLLGIEVQADDAIRILSRLGFQPRRNGEAIDCSVPSWRSDVYCEADLIEEVARHYGYDKIPTQHKIEIEVTGVDAYQRMARSMVTYLNGCGFYETINISFIDNSLAEFFTQGSEREHLAVTDVTRKSANLLRQSLLPSLFGVIKANYNTGSTSCRVFEIADTYIPSGKAGLPNERRKLAIACDSDFRDIRGVVEGLIKSISADATVDFKPCATRWGQTSAQIVANGVAIGEAGVLSQILKDKFDFKDVTICGAELDVEGLSRLQAGQVKVKPIPKFPAIKRDLSLIVDENLPWVDIERVVNAKASAQLEEVRFVDLYRGKGIPAGKKSITLSLLFRDPDGTLTHEAVDGFESQIVAELAASAGAVLRTA